jgi:hypothetical protein
MAGNGKYSPKKAPFYRLIDIHNQKPAGHHSTRKTHKKRTDQDGSQTHSTSPSEVIERGFTMRMGESCQKVSAVGNKVV